jgi:hypothetical protein
MQSTGNEMHNMPIYRCSCGEKILVVPDLAAMDKAIKNHVLRHNIQSEEHLTEEGLTREILKMLSQTNSECPK